MFSPLSDTLFNEPSLLMEIRLSTDINLIIISLIFNLLNWFIDFNSQELKFGVISRGQKNET